VSKSIGVFLVLSSLGGLGLQAAVWEDPAQRTTSSWQAVYEAPKTEYGAGHRGVDLVLETDSKISAPAAGVLYFKGLVVDREVVTIRTTDGYLASFEPACTNLEVGERVKLGQEIAWHCEPSASYEYHCDSCVHFSARSAYGYISPDYLLGNLKPSVLEG
jgi:murein DD-endopeptidase MepM/ murein hydrolase activator NlpD